MIGAPGGIVAVFEQHPHERRVIAFDDEGSALIVGYGSLERASDIAGFVELCDAGDFVPVAIVPAPPGASLHVRAFGDEWMEPIVAWAVTSAGCGTPLVADHAGGVEPLHSWEFDQVTIQHTAA